MNQHPTEEIELPDHTAIAQDASMRIALAIRAVRGIDDATLKILGTKEKDGKTKLQHILDRITWTGLPTLR